MKLKTDALQILSVQAETTDLGELNSAENTPRSLRILPEESLLRTGSAIDSDQPFLRAMEWPRDEHQDPPRALRALGRIVNEGLCHRCGSCVGICPTGVLGRDRNEYPKIEHLSACTDCDLCVKVCPGDEFDYEAAYRQMFASEPDLKATHGHFEFATLAHATDTELRQNSTSGGLVTGLLLDLIDRGEIDGAVVIASDEKELWRGKPVVARTRAEILEAVKSKYAISPTNAVFGEILKTPGKYALVGLPCQLHGFVKAAELDQRLKERVVLTIGLFCHAAIDHEAFEIIWNSLGDKAEGALKFVSRIGKHPGAPHIQCKDKSWFPVYFGQKKGFRPSSMEMINILYRLYTPERCLTCFDALSEFSDISVGDPWMAPPSDDVDFKKGWSFSLVRTKRGKACYDRAVEDGKILSRALTRKEALSCNRKMATEKRWRAFRIIETHRRQGKALPSYGDPTREFPRHSGLQFVETEGNVLTHILCFVPALRAKVLRFFLGEGGYWLLWLNNKRRWLRFWMRDTIARLKRNLLGRS